MAENTVAGLLSLRLVFDGDKAKEGLERTDKQIKNIGDVSKKVGRQINSELTGAFENFFKKMFPLAGITSGIYALSKAHGQLLETSKTAESFNIGIETFSTWGKAAELMGYKSEEATSSLITLKQGMAEAAYTGKSVFAGVFSKLGVKFTEIGEDGVSHFRKLDDVMLDISKTLSKMPADRARHLGQMAGLSPKAIAMLRDYDGLLKSIERSKRYAMTEEEAKANRQLEGALQGVYGAVDLLSRKIMLALTPIIIEVVGWVEELTASIAESPWLDVAVKVGGFVVALKAVLIPAKAIFSILTKLVSVGKTVAGALSGLVSTVAVIGRAFGAAAKVLGGFFGVIGRGLLLAARAHPLIAALSTIALVVKDFFNWINGAPSLSGMLLEKLGLTPESFKPAMDAIDSLISKAKGVAKWLGFDVGGEEESEGEEPGASNVVSTSDHALPTVDAETIQRHADNFMSYYAPPVNSTALQTVDSHDVKVQQTINFEVGAGSPEDIRDAVLRGVSDANSRWDNHSLVSQIGTGVRSK